MSYYDDLSYLYNNRNTSQCSAEEIDKIIQKFNVFCGEWYNKATAGQVWDFMKLFHGDAPTAQNEFVYYLIDNIIERFPKDSISEVINHLQDLEQTEGRSCAFYLIISICRKQEYVKYCLDALHGASILSRNIALDEMQKNGNDNAIEIIDKLCQNL